MQTIIEGTKQSVDKARRFISVHAQRVSMFLYHKRSEECELKEIAIVNGNSQKQIIVNRKSVLTLKAPKTPCTELVVIVVCEVCKELGCTTWWNDLIKTFRSDKKRVPILMKRS